MSFDRTQLVQKLITKGFELTPIEIIRLKYLSRVDMLQQITVKGANSYKEVKEIEAPINSNQIQLLTLISQSKYSEELRSYNYAYDEILRQDYESGIFGYKGIAILTQLAAIRHEYFAKEIIDEDLRREKIENSGIPNIMNFYTYSFVHGKNVRVEQLISTFGETLKLLIKSVDNILILNLYLDNLIELEDLDCLKFLKMWIGKNPDTIGEYDIEPLFRFNEICTPEIIDLILEKNHESYYENLKGYPANMPSHSTEDSLIYVKDIVKKTIFLEKIGE